MARISRKKKPQNILKNLAGMFLALITVEIFLIPFATGKGGVPAPDEALVAGAAPNSDKIIKIKQFQEGFGTAHFASDGRRLTGNDELPGASSGVIIGDSFVEALQVNDTETMGSDLERLARVEGQPINVRQYGWGGTSIATYLAVAGELNRKWNPDWVAVVFNDDDFTDQSLSTGRFWRMEIDPISHKISVIHVARAGGSLDPLLARVGLSSNDLRDWLNKSSLAYLSVEKFLVTRGQQDQNPDQSVAKPDLDIKRQATAAAAMVHELKLAYSENLIVVFVPQIDAVSDTTPQPIERVLSSVCENEAVKFISTRNAMIEQRDAEHTLSEGFINTVPGGGHLNSRGHQIVANAMWRTIIGQN